MLRRLRGCLLAACLLAGQSLAVSREALAAFHVWDIVEVYSDASGTVQFIELFSNANGQHVVVSNQGGIKSNSQTVLFRSDLPSNQTANRRFLVGTTGYSELAAADDNVPAPDYVVPNNFFSTSGDSLRAIWFASQTAFDTLTFTANDLPTDGIHSLNQDFGDGSTNYTMAVNSPENFARQIGSIMPVMEGLPGDYNDDGVVNAADYVVWRNAVESGGSLVNEGDNPGTVDQGDYDFWVANFGETGGGGSSFAIPEPAGISVLVALLAPAVVSRLRLSGR